MKPLSKRTKRTISTNKLTAAINLFHKHVDEEVTGICIITPTLYKINETNQSYGMDGGYTVNIATNKVKKCYPDPSW